MKKSFDFSSRPIRGEAGWGALVREASLDYWPAGWTMISTRRLFARPSALLFAAIGLVEPSPLAVIRSAAILKCRVTSSAAKDETLMKCTCVRRSPA